MSEGKGIGANQFIKPNTCRCKSCKENKSLLADGFRNQLLHLGITVGVGAADYFDIIRHQDRPGDGLILYPADLPHSEEYVSFCFAVNFSFDVLLTFMMLT